jgi:DNA-binding LacI/PurR family transcriptional regulator/nitrogen-specific signal transduction histidine kinase
MTWFGDTSSMRVVTAVADLVRERGVNVVCFSGGRPHPSHGHASDAAALHDLVSAESVDGLVFISGALEQMLGREGLLLLAEKYATLPRVSVSVELPNCASVLVDIETGLRDLIAHLIESHGHRRIGFIRGAATSRDAENRLRIYREVMKDHGLEVDPDWIGPVATDWASGRRAIEILVSERNRTDLEAIVVASDEAARGAIEALQARGFRVPDQIAVVGCEDTESYSFGGPALTTVRRPHHKLGRRAAANLLAQMEGDRVDEQFHLPTEAVIRESCGCSPRVGSADRSSAPSGFSSLLAANRERIIGDMAQALESIGLGALGWLERLVDAFGDDIEQATESRFSQAFEELLSQDSPVGGDDAWAWQNAVAVLRHWVTSLVGDDRARVARASDLWRQARLVVGGVARRAEAHKLVTGETVSRISQALIGTIDLKDLADVMAEWLAALRVRSFWLSLYEDRKAKADGSRLILSYEEGRGVRLEEAEPLPANELLRNGILVDDRHRTLVFQPLYFKSDQLGFVVYEMSLRDTAVLDELRQQLSSALMRIHREDDLAKNQERLLISEKMAALGRLTAGMAHEMNTPLAAVRTALDELSGLVEEYEASVTDSEVTPEDHGAIAKEMTEAIRVAASAAEKVAGFVHGIKFQTRDLSTREYRRFNAVPVVADTLLLLNHALRKVSCNVAFEHAASTIELFGSPGRLAQVVTNLVTNAIDASRPKGGGPIVLSLAEQEGIVVLKVADQGHGIPSEIINRIFDPMFTTKPFGEGTGLGLSIVHDIVTTDFGGAIEVDTEVGRGTTFTLSLAVQEGSS